MRWHYLSWLLSLPTHLSVPVAVADALSFLKRQWAEWSDLIRGLLKL